MTILIMILLVINTFIMVGEMKMLITEELKGKGEVAGVKRRTAKPNQLVQRFS